MYNVRIRNSHYILVVQYNAERYRKKIFGFWCQKAAYFRESLCAHSSFLLLPIYEDEAICREPGVFYLYVFLRLKNEQGH